MKVTYIHRNFVGVSPLDEKDPVRCWTCVECYALNEGHWKMTTPDRDIIHWRQQ